MDFSRSCAIRSKMTQHQSMHSVCMISFLPFYLFSSPGKSRNEEQVLMCADSEDVV